MLRAAYLPITLTAIAIAIIITQKRKHYVQQDTAPSLLLYYLQYVHPLHLHLQLVFALAQRVNVARIKRTVDR